METLILNIKNRRSKNDNEINIFTRWMLNSCLQVFWYEFEAHQKQTDKLHVSPVCMQQSSQMVEDCSK